MNTSTKPRLLTVKQAAQLIDGLSEYRIRCLIKSGVLPHIQCGNKPLISEQVLYDTIRTMTT